MEGQTSLAAMTFEVRSLGAPKQRLRPSSLTSIHRKARFRKSQSLLPFPPVSPADAAHLSGTQSGRESRV